MNMARPLAKVVFAEPLAPSGDPGPIPDLKWLPLHALVVDPRYQREIATRGRQNIRRIVEGFDWSCFSPLVVSPRDDGSFAIIDGQHRATAALMHGGIEAVPCQIIHGDQTAQARAFATINGQVTGILQTQLFYARVAAGEPEATALAELLNGCGVTVLKQPVSRDPRPGETLAIGTLQSCLKAYGSDTLIVALKAVVETRDGNPGLLRASIIKAVCDLLHARLHWRDAGGSLFDAFDRIDLALVLREAEAGRAAYGGSLSDQVRIAIKKRLIRTLGE